MPGGIPPKKRSDTVFGEIVLAEPQAAEKSWTWTCKHCQHKFSWCSTKRTRMHLACVDKFISHCPAVTEEVRAREAAVVTSKKRLKRKRQQDQTALNEAAAARKAEHADRLKEKITRGILVLKDGKHIPQRLRKGAFGTGDALNWALLDEAVVDFWCLHGFALHLLDNKKWRSIIDLSRKTSAAYRPPSSRNDGRSASFETILEDRQQVTNELVDAKLTRIEVCGAIIVCDASTVYC